MTPKPSKIWLIAIVLASILIDQISKFAILMAFDGVEMSSVAVLPFLDFTLIWNSGISYGLLSDQSQLARFGLIGLSICIIGFLIYLLRSEHHPWLRVGYALIIGGAIGNVIDRVIHGAVVDFISLHGFGYYWYVFNLADIWITLGGAVVVLLSLRPAKTTSG